MARARSWLAADPLCPDDVVAVVGEVRLVGNLHVGFSSVVMVMVMSWIPGANRTYQPSAVCTIVHGLTGVLEPGDDLGTHPVDDVIGRWHVTVHRRVLDPYRTTASAIIDRSVYNVSAEADHPASWC